MYYMTLYYFSVTREETSNIDCQSNFVSLAWFEHLLITAIIKNKILTGQNERRPEKHENLFRGIFCFKLPTAIFLGYRQGRNWRDD